MEETIHFTEGSMGSKSVMIITFVLSFLSGVSRQCTLHSLLIYYPETDQIQTCQNGSRLPYQRSTDHALPFETQISLVMELDNQNLTI